MIFNSRKAVPGFFAIMLLLTSCVGIDTKVKISREGSGSVTAVYSLSEELVAFGELEANKAMLPVPLTKQEVEDSLRGISGLSLTSWSSKKDGTDLVISTVIAFDSLYSLMYYLDPQGRLAKHDTSPEGNRIAFTVGDSLPVLDPDMKKIAQEAFAPYSFKFVIELPSAAKEALSGNPAIGARKDGNTVYFEGKMMDVVATELPPSMTISW